MRHAVRLWILLGLAASLTFGQSTGAAAEPKKIRLEGSVLSTTGEPVRKASLQLQGTATQGGQPATYTESSGNDGKFLFDDVPPGRYTLTAEKTGFVTGRYGARTPSSPGTPLNVAAGQEMKDLALLLTPQGVISGKVFDQDGDPIAQAEIMVMRAGYNQGRRELLPAGGTSADDQGSFRIANLAPGRYYLSAQDYRSVTFGTEDLPGRAGAPKEDYPITYYPGVTEIASAAPVDVTAGSELAGISLRLRKSRVFSIRGRAIDAATGGPPLNLVVMALPRNSGGASVTMLMSRSMQQVRGDGSFEIRNLSPGVYVLQNLTSFSSGNTTVARVTGHLEVAITNADVDGVTLVLGPGAEINGRMSFEGGGRIVSGARPGIALVPADGSNLGTPKTQLRDDGTFQIKGVPASRFVLNVGALPEGTYVKAVRFGNADVTKEVLDLTSGAGGTLDIVLGSKAAGVSGMLRNEKGEVLSGISVTLWPKDLTASSPWTRVHSLATDQAGSFEFTGLAPGDYYVAAWDDAESGLLENADFLARFTNDAATLKLDEGSREAANLKLITRDKIAIEAAKIQ